MEKKNTDSDKTQNNAQHLAKAYGIYQTYIWTVVLLIGGIALLIKFLLR